MAKTPARIVLASGNRGKVRELSQMLSAFHVEVVPQSEFGIAGAEETGVTFIENALIKARHAAVLTGLPAIADDSGIAVEGLNGAPGVYSAQYAGPGATDGSNLQKLLEDTRHLPDGQRAANFICVLVFLAYPGDPMPIIAQGTWSGELLRAPVGENGFGYDPIFYVPTYRCSSAQLPPEVKNQLSHRGQALRSLLAQFTERHAGQS
ncbi:MAG TPA: RdgB/HAM1 family non-canonical purine NTP pyrophosphatase [Gammaproteobacteria bacterium]|nr:RdgB/HAM1 family non-canonical purine NTP pyrophosphatase [Gammaproteobacteria bacterium]